MNILKKQVNYPDSFLHLLAIACTTLAVGLFLPSDWHWINLPFHASLETAGAVIAILVGSLVILFGSHQGELLLPVAFPMGLFAMGIFDGLHAETPPGHLFVWLHSLATFVGGIFFATILFPVGRKTAKENKFLVPLAAFISILISTWSILDPSMVPVMLANGHFTLLAKLLNITGGLLFAFAAIRLNLLYKERGERHLQIFAILCVLFSGAGLLFDISDIWTMAWWWWHLVRVGAYILSAVIMIERFKVADYAAERRFRLVVEAAPNAMIMVNNDKKISLVNPAAEKLFGYSHAELVNQELEMLIPLRFRSNHPEQVRQFFHKPTTRALGVGRDLYGQRKDGKEIPIEIGLNPLVTEEGLFVLASIIDISERKKIELMKNEFISTVSHELRAPLTSIMGSLGLMAGNAAGELPEKAKPLVQIALSNSERLIRLINDILDIEKIESGKMDFNLRATDLVSLVKQSVTVNETYSQQYGIRLEMAPSAECGIVNIEPDRIIQVITNLISNAVKFSPKNEGVTISVKKNADKIRVQIKDHGPGIPLEFKTRIFGKFAQADSSDARQRGGTGLGLNICKAIIEKHGGEINYEPVPEGGTVFFFELPLMQNDGN